MTRPTPVEDRIRNGNPGKRAIPLPRDVGGRPTALPAAPSGLSVDAKRLWKQYVEPLVRGHVFDTADAEMVEVAVTLHRQLNRIRKAVDALTDGDLVQFNERTGMPHAHPLLGQERETANALRLVLGELGKSPVARTRLPSRTAEQAEDAMEQEIGRPPRLRAVGGQDDD